MAEIKERNISGCDTTIHDTICWQCANAVPSQYTGCPWSEKGLPVEGWEAEDTTDKHIDYMSQKYIDSGQRMYNVYDCPMFMMDSRRTDWQTSLNRSGLSKLGVDVVKVAAFDLESEYRKFLLAYHRKKVSKKHYKKDEIAYHANQCIHLLQFFRSEYCEELSKVNGEWLAKKVLDKTEADYITERLGEALEIHLTGKKWLVTDSFQYWIESRTPDKDKKGNDVINKRRLSGYYSDIDKLFESYFDHTLKESQMVGEIEDMMKLVKKTRAEIRKWTREIRGDVDD